MNKENYLKIRDHIKLVIKDISKCQKENKNTIKNRYRHLNNTEINGSYYERLIEAEKIYPLSKGKYYESYNRGLATAMHVVYNRFRNRPPHTGSEQSDSEAMHDGGYLAEKLFEKIKEQYPDE